MSKKCITRRVRGCRTYNMSNMSMSIDCVKCMANIPEEYINYVATDELYIYCDGEQGWFCPNCSPTTNCMIDGCPCCNPNDLYNKDCSKTSTDSCKLATKSQEKSTDITKNEQKKQG